jgi:hypothetical protein
MECDEWLRPAVKSKEHEEKLRDMYTRSLGLDKLKQSNTKLSEETKTIKSQAEKLQSAFTEFNTYLKNDDLDSFFQACNLDEKKIFNWVKAKIEYSEMDSDAKRAYDESRNFKQRSYTRDQELEKLQDSYHQVLTQQRNFELDHALSKPDVQTVVQAYNEYAQKENLPSFRDEVIRLGQWHARSTGEDLPTEVVVQEMAKRYGILAQQKTPPAQPAAQTAPVVPNRPPVIPVVGGGNTSPIHKSVGSLDDLKAIRKEKFGY